MEEKRPGPHPEADRAADTAGQNGSARRGAEAGGPSDAERDRIRQADARGREDAAALKAAGFGDHQGVESFPSPDRSE